ncbi:MAG: hydrogenase 4 subunit F [Candidatus Riflebacteria bacterium]|nr:hydrogenase 4 subunit F [Candidatus Riflebacteria bacterium]
MEHGWLLASLVVVPVLAGLLSQVFTSREAELETAVGGVLVTAGLGALAIGKVFSAGPLFGFSRWLFLDALSAYHLAVMLVVFTLSSLFALRYFGEEVREGRLTLAQVRTFAGLWPPALGAMVLVVVSNNLGIMWVGMEATTLVTSFLICVHMTRGSLEAMWKYMLICSVGIGFAFLGTLMIRVAAKDLPLDPNQALLWTNLLANTGALAPSLVKAAFLFVLVGYGTKAGLAPLHTWLPDAHSKAPAPVSAVFSGFMLNTALYCVLRYVPLVEGATGHTGWALRLLTGFGLFSILVAAAFILWQHDLKRLLAYHSVEHLGIIALGFGLGGLGTFAALFHTFNHSLCKTLSFFAAGRLGQVYGTHDMERMGGSCTVAPVWGIGLLGSLLALIGMAPFCLFMSELQILKAAVDGGNYAVVALFLAGTGAVFLGALGHALPLALGKPSPAVVPAPAGGLDVLLVAGPLVVLLLLGVWMPGPCRGVLEQAAAIVQHGSAVLPGGGR